MRLHDHVGVTRYDDADFRLPSPWCLLSRSRWFAAGSSAQCGCMFLRTGLLLQTLLPSNGVSSLFHLLRHVVRSCLLHRTWCSSRFLWHLPVRSALRFTSSWPATGVYPSLFFLRESPRSTPRRFRLLAGYRGPGFLNWRGS
jgi:hypothetical protein